MAERELLIQIIALSSYVLFMGFCFCDGFKLHVVRKLIWFITFAAISIFVFRSEGEYNIALILPVPSLLAFLLCAHEKVISKREEKG